MALLSWAFAWFAMSVLIFAAGRLLPQVRPKPPPVLLAPKHPSRSPHSARIRSLPPTPTSPPLKPLPAEPDDRDATSLASEPQGSLESESSSKLVSSPSPARRPGNKSRWSISHLRHGNGRAVPSPKSSILSSEGSATLAESTTSSAPSPRFFPELAMIDSDAPPMTEAEAEFDRAPSPPLTASPKPGRNMRLPKVFKSFSRRVSSSRQRSSGPTLSPASSPVAGTSALPALEKACTEPEQLDGAPPLLKGRAVSLDPPPAPSRSQQNQNPSQGAQSASGEVFTTTFVNPFRLKPRRPKTASASPEQSAPAVPPRRVSGPRRVLTSLSLSLASSSSAVAATSSSTPYSHGHAPAPDSPRSSVSSVSTFSAPSSSFSLGSPPAPGSPESQRSAKRTQPYGPPYYAPMPSPSPAAGVGVGAGAGRSRSRGRSGSGSGNGSSNGSSTGGGTGGRPTPRRAVSLDVPARPETVAEADEAEAETEEDANVLGLELGQVRPAPADVRTAPVGGARNRRLNRHRVMASEGMALLERGR